ncbi:MAG: ATP-binding cassette domain-containing protein [Synergistaceae bacterium]|nr:ATP-binding cassette domain-containing protein [Synergistaceae bacterium]
MIELEHIIKNFQSARTTDKKDKKDSIHAVNDVSLKINDGDIFGIIGFSGAGKSTLVRCINLLERPDSGSVKIDGVEMMTLKPKELYKARTKIGMIFQQFNLMPSRTVFQNVAYPLRDMTKEQVRARVRELLSLVEISDKENAYPSELSGGQKQRVAIARALANDPTILLCDEATSALDPQTTASILQLLKDLNKKLGLTIVVITHEMEVVKNICLKAAVMDAGKIIETGDVFEIFSNPKHTVTKNFVRTTSNLSKIETLIRDDSPMVRLKPGELMARLVYIHADVSEPLISYASRAFDIEINIILADVEIVAGAMVGGTVVIFNGEREKINRAIQYYRDKDIRVEVIQDAGA